MEYEPLTFKRSVRVPLFTTVILLALISCSVACEKRVATSPPPSPAPTSPSTGVPSQAPIEAPNQVAQAPQPVAPPAPPAPATPQVQANPAPQSPPGATSEDIGKLTNSLDQLQQAIDQLKAQVAAAAQPAPPPPPPPISPPPPGPAGSNAAPATPAPAAVRKPLGDYVPCLFARSDDTFLRGRSLTDALQALASDQVAIGRLDPANRAQLVAVLVGASSTIGSISEPLARAQAIKTLVTSLFDNVLHTVPTDAGLDPVGQVQSAVTLALTGQSAQQVASTLDVGCSQSLLSYDEAKDIFGTRIANTYLVVQVTVRNLNANEEFMMHDVQIALDATTLPVSIKFGTSSLNNTRFVAGRDKMLARGVASVGQQMDPRNFLVRLAEALGDVTLAAATVTGRAHFIDGVSIYKSVLIPGLKSVYPDLTIDQLNRLNDLGFSSSTAYKIVVPKNGSVPFVTFLPAKIFAGPPYPSSTASSSTQRDANSWQYKKWTQEEMLLLQESLYVVFAGVHVVEDTGNSSITKLDCPSTGGYLDLSKKTTDANKNDVLACPVTGTGLKAGMSLSLRSNDSTITQTIDSTLNVTSDTAGSASFKISDLDGAQTSQYTLYLVTASGAQATTLTVKLQPAITGVTAPPAACTANCSFSVAGTNLGLITQIGLRLASQTNVDAFLTDPIPVGTAKAGALAVKVSKAVPKNTYNLWLYYSGQSVPVDSGKTLAVP